MRSEKLQDKINELEDELVKRSEEFDRLELSLKGKCTLFLFLRPKVKTNN